MNAIPYEFALPNLPHGFAIDVPFKQDFETIAQRGGVPLAEAQAVYRDLVRHRLWEINPALMTVELQRKHESYLAYLPTYPALIRVVADPAHPLCECVMRRQDVVTEQLAKA